MPFSIHILSMFGSQLVFSCTRSNCSQKSPLANFCIIQAGFLKPRTANSTSNQFLNLHSNSWNWTKEIQSQIWCVYLTAVYFLFIWNFFTECHCMYMYVREWKFKHFERGDNTCKYTIHTFSWSWFSSYIVH